MGVQLIFHALQPYHFRYGILVRACINIEGWGLVSSHQATTVELKEVTTLG